MTEYTPKQRRDLAESCISHLGLNDRAAAQALVAIFDLLDERLPEKPMQVIPTPSAPEDKPSGDLLNSRLGFICTESSSLLRVVACSDGDIEFEITDPEGGYSIVYLSSSDAERLARAIIDSI